MERYQRGHQQPVEGERPIGVLLVFACLTVAIASWDRLRFGLRFGGGVSKR